ncbi:biphenyl 2,3-dioxygenase [Salipaludibacillus keqinensis]|uniref:Biphenyl 2,3-dioxygenase n=1 Tax=Salipaludibacillus keqinensis TaxID=2045207 RepID=A0A323T9I7_9BACI|nr:PAS domain-containing protein [Salipaludibacillus keqinensis]PYZ92059.1 biphenyl 2,3-dioxygenase [Salipaludibacillus keqinensis]
MPHIQKLKDKVLEKTQLVFIITDPNLPDNPVIYANQGFTSLTGYSQEEVIGHNCRFMQGEKTDPAAVDKIRQAVEKFEPVSVEILNYKKNGDPFWNLLHLDPIYLEEEDQYYIVGIQKDISDFKQAEEKISTYNREIELLSTPLVPIKKGVSVLPLIGNVDEHRVDSIIERILPELTKEDVEILIMDLSGFSNMDEQATVGIFQLNDLLKLKGVQLIITGVTPKIAMRTQGLDIDFSNFTTYGSVKQAIEALE